MQDTLRELILDFQRRPPEAGVPRSMSVERVRGKATVCIGVRRAGKTTWLAQQAAARAAEAGSRDNLLYINFFDERLCDLWADGRRLGEVIDAYFSLYPDKRGREPISCFFDEIQMVPGWESFVDRLMRTERCEVFIAGSSASLLSSEVATQMRGRSLVAELFPFSFAEYLRARGVPGGPLDPVRRTAAEAAFREYWETGGFPEVLSVSAPTRVAIHQDYLRAVCLRDVVERHGVRHPRAVRDLALRLVNTVAGAQTLNRLTAHLQSLGHKIPKTVVGECVDWMEDAFFFFQVRLFDPSLARRNANPRKVYVVDHALARSCGTGVLVNSGHLLENLVFLALRRRGEAVHYYRTRSGREVDFAWRDRKGRIRLVQVCESLAAEKTRKRELSALAEAMEETGAEKAALVVREGREDVRLGRRRVSVVPAWRWLLEEEDGA